MFEGLVDLVVVAEVLASFGLASETKGLVDLIQICEKFVQLFSLLGSLVKLLEESCRLLGHDSVVALKGGNGREVVDQVGE